MIVSECKFGSTGLQTKLFYVLYFSPLNGIFHSTEIMYMIRRLGSGARFIIFHIKCNEDDKKNLKGRVHSDEIFLS
jgi:hypothetical protein